MIVLLVGGPADGRRVDVPDGCQYVRIAERIGFELTPNYGAQSHCQHVRDVEYNVVTHQAGFAFAVMRHVDNPLAVLIQGYRHEVFK